MDLSASSPNMELKPIWHPIKKAMNESLTNISLKGTEVQLPHLEIHRKSAFASSFSVLQAKRMRASASSEKAL